MAITGDHDGNDLAIVMAMEHYVAGRNWQVDLIGYTHFMNNVGSHLAMQR